MSPPIAVADATPVHFSFRLWKPSCNVQIRFFTDAEGTIEVGTLGTGQRDLTVTNTASAYEGPFSDPTARATFVSNLTNGVIANVVDGKWIEVPFGSGMGNMTIVAAADSNPIGSATYRVIAEVEGTCTV